MRQRWRETEHSSPRAPSLIPAPRRDAARHPLTPQSYRAAPDERLAHLRGPAVRFADSPAHGLLTPATEAEQQAWTSRQARASPSQLARSCAEARASRSGSSLLACASPLRQTATSRSPLALMMRHKTTYGHCLSPVNVRAAVNSLTVARRSQPRISALEPARTLASTATSLVRCIGSFLQKLANWVLSLSSASALRQALLPCRAGRSLPAQPKAPWAVRQAEEVRCAGRLPRHAQEAQLTLYRCLVVCSEGPGARGVPCPGGPNQRRCDGQAARCRGPAVLVPGVHEHSGSTPFRL